MCGVALEKSLETLTGPKCHCHGWQELAKLQFRTISFGCLSGPSLMKCVFLTFKLQMAWGLGGLKIAFSSVFSSVGIVQYLRPWSMFPCFLELSHWQQEMELFQSSHRGLRKCENLRRLLVVDKCWFRFLLVSCFVFHLLWTWFIAVMFGFFCNVSVIWLVAFCLLQKKSGVINSSIF